MKKNILIVDDADINLYIYKRFLSPLDQICEIFTADSGARALSIISQQKIDLILTDIHMAGMNGYELIEKIRSDEITRNSDEIKIIILSADCDEDPRAALSDEQVLIPVEKKLLLERVNEHLGLGLNLV